MTVGQSNDLGSAPHEFLLQKAGFIPPVQWVVEELAILVREKTQINRQLSTRMNLWGTINLRDFTVHQLGTPSRFYEPQPLLSAPGSNEADSNAFGKTGTSTQQSLCFSTVNATWEPYFYSADGDVHDKPDTLSVATYNVLAEFHYPPSRVRYPLIVSNLLDPLARSDVLVLQEVTDDFLCFLLSDPHIRKEYPFVSNGPPDQLDIDPLPSHLNIVALSKWSYTWEWVPFQRRHKGSLVLRFDQIGDQQGERFFPTVLSTIHLTCGLTDGSVTAKQTQLQAILRYLSTTYHSNPWILAGDFNITTSACAINAALEKRSISPQGHDHLIHLDTLLSESGLLDTWTMACLDNVISPDLEDSQQSFTEGFEGEAGATFDPITNELAAAILGTGMNNRPQRYDRILIKPGNLLSIGGFNMFGKQPHVTETGNELQTIGNVSYASDHWGVRCSLKLQPATPVKPSETQILYLKVPTLVKTVSASLADASAIRKYLLDHQIYPSATDHTIRENALELLRSVLNSNRTQAVPLQTQPGVQFVVVPVGSYGLGTWTASSDVDCLCIGPISSKTFFALAAQKFRKAASEEFKVLRRVNALSGTMLELDILGIKMDLHYCPSALIAETWPRAMYIPVTSPVFALPAQILAKLKPARDMYYLRRTMPDSAAFRTACHLIKTWAKQHGIYAARFGYLGGIHIAVLLATICKSLSRNNGPVPLASIILTFFNHYANFDWQNDIVFDPFFHKSLRYVRTSREPMVILGYHSPGLNVATAASQPSVRTIAEELKRANRKLSTDGMTWDAFLRHGSTTDSGSAAFVKAYISFLKIDVQFWGASLAKGSQYVGWLESRCVMLLVGKSTHQSYPALSSGLANVIQTSVDACLRFTPEYGLRALLRRNWLMRRQTTKAVI